MFSSILTLLFTGGQLYWEFNSDIKKINYIENQIDNSFLKSIETAVWAINEQQVMALLEGVVALPSVTKASIINDDGFSFSIPNKNIPSDKVITRILRPPTKITNHNEIGILKIEQTTQEAYINFKKRLATVLLFNFLKTFLVASFLLYLFHILVSKRILKISTFMEQMTLASSNKKLEIEQLRNHTADELDHFVDSFNNMQSKLNRAWKDLGNSEKRFRCLVEGSLQGILILDQDWNYLYANQKYFDKFSFVEDKATKPDVRKIFPKGTIKKVCSFFDSNDEGTIYLDELTLSFAKGIERLVQAIFVQTTHEGKPAVQIVMYDITNLKEMKAQQKDYEMQLIHNNKMAAVGTMLSGVTHEINNPNHMIKQNSIILSDTWKSLSPSIEELARKYPEKQYNNLQLSDILEIIPVLINDIRLGSDSINSIVDDLKSFVRQDQSCNYVEASINTIISDTVNILRLPIEKKCKNFKLKLADDLPKVWAYPQRLSQVFINLIVNALESLEDSTKSIVISTYHLDNNVFISFKDQGSGIPKELQKTVFDIFISTKQDVGGTGLGLSISQSIINQHHGKIILKSDINKGSEFIIELCTDKKPMDSSLVIN